MDIGIVSMRYAKALMEYAKSMGAEDTLYKEFCMLDRSFRKHPDLSLIHISIEKGKKLLEQAGGKTIKN